MYVNWIHTIRVKVTKETSWRYCFIIINNYALTLFWWYSNLYKKTLKFKKWCHKIQDCYTLPQKIAFIRSNFEQKLSLTLSKVFCIFGTETAIDVDLAWIDRGEYRLYIHYTIIKKASWGCGCKQADNLAEAPKY